MSTATVLPFMGGELGSFDPSDSTVIEVTTAGKFNPTFARGAIAILGSNDYAQSPTWAAASSFWMHAEYQGPNPYSGGYANGLVLWQFFNGATEVLRVTNGNGFTTTDATILTLQSGVLTAVGTVTWTQSGLQRLDIGLVAGGSGSVEVFVSGTQQLSVSGLNHSGFAGVTQIRLSGANTPFAAGSYWSQVICDSVSHVGDFLYTYPLDTNSGTNTGWTGGVSNVNEIVLNDANFDYAGSAALTSTFLSSTTNLTAYTVVAIGLGIRALATSGSPAQHLEPTIRVSGANYSTASCALTPGYQACAGSWTVNPATSSAWTGSIADGVEGGMLSVT